MQTVSNIIIVFGLVLVASGGFGHFHFGKKLDKEKELEQKKNESEINRKMEILILGNNTLEKSNQELSNMLEPIKEIAKKKYPSEDISTAINFLTEEYARLNKKTERTVFEVVGFADKKLPNGGVEKEIHLTAIGQNIIPIFKIQCRTKNGVKISSFSVLGPTVPGMSFDRANDNQSIIDKEFRTMYPGTVTIIIATETDPENIYLTIDPLKEDKK